MAASNVTLLSSFQLLTIFLSMIQVGFVNSLAFAKSGQFLVAGVGQVIYFINLIWTDLLLLFCFSEFGTRGVKINLNLIYEVCI